jgi:hypothetical protein
LFRSTVKTFNRFPDVTAQVIKASLDGLRDATRAAAAVAQESASIDLHLVEVAPSGDLEGYSAGIKANRRSDVADSTTPIALFFDQGTLGNRTKALKRGRKGTWTQRNPGGSGTHTQNRGDIDGKGIPAEHFFTKARAAGRAVLRAKISEELGPLK